MWPALCVHMEALARQMGDFPPCEGPAGQRGIHRDLVSNGTLDIQLSLALKFNRQVIRIWKAALKGPREKNKQRTRERDQESEGWKLTWSTQRASWTQVFISIPIDNAGMSDGYASLTPPQPPSSVLHFIPCVEKPNCLNVGYTRMMDISSQGKN